VAPSIDQYGLIVEAVITPEKPASATQSPVGTSVPVLSAGQATAVNATVFSAPGPVAPSIE
jgi:hypothetical protein